MYMQVKKEGIQLGLQDGTEGDRGELICTHKCNTGEAVEVQLTYALEELHLLIVYQSQEEEQEEEEMAQRALAEVFPERQALILTLVTEEPEELKQEEVKLGH